MSRADSRLDNNNAIKMQLIVFLLLVAGSCRGQDSGHEPTGLMQVCLNQGSLNYTGGRIRCQCKTDSYPFINGPACQATRVNLAQATDEVSALITLAPIAHDGQFHFQCSFVTNSFDSIGHVISVESNEANSMQIFLTLEKGMPKVSVLINKYPFILTTSEWKPLSLTDNQWHSIDIFVHSRSPLVLSMFIDRCQRNEPTCQQSMALQGTTSLSQLNLPKLVRVGNKQQTSVAMLCLENVRVQGELVDFFGTRVDALERLGCPYCEVGCLSNNLCGQHGLCRNSFTDSNMLTCRCKNGFWPEIGNASRTVDQSPCESRSQVKSTTNEMFQYSLEGSKPLPLTYKLAWRQTARQNMEILYVRALDLRVSQYNSQHVDFRLEGATNETLRLDSRASLTDGNWHIIEVGLSKPTSAPYAIMSLTLDGFSTTQKLISSRALTAITSASQRPPLNIRIAFNSTDTCLDDFWLELPNQVRDYGSQMYPLQSLQQSNALRDGCTSTSQCSEVNCPNNLSCKELWRGYECGCPTNLTMSRQGPAGSQMCVVPQCEPNPCFKQVQCKSSSSNFNTDYECICLVGWTGKNCDQQEVSYASVPWWVVFIIIFIILLLLIVMGLLIFWYRRNILRKKYEDMITHMETEKINESMRMGKQMQAGEVDFQGKLDFDLLSIKPPYQATHYRRPIVEMPRPPPTPPRSHHSNELVPNNTHGLKTTEKPPWLNDAYYNNRFLHLDQTLNYAFEGFPSLDPPTSPEIWDSNPKHQRF